MTTENMNDMSMKEFMDQVDASMRKLHRGEIVKGTIISLNENELMVNIGYITDGIIPKSEALEGEGEIKDYFKIGEEIYAYILDINDGEGNVLLSKKKADRVKVWDDLESFYKNQEVFEVTVNEIVKGGAIARIKGLRAFIPASQISLSFVKDLNGFVGKTLNVKIIEFDSKKEKIVLSAKEVEKKIAEERKAQLWNSVQKGEIRSGVVKKLAKFGAFVDIGGLEGLVHVSELSWGRVKDPSQVLSVGDNVKVYVLDVDKEKERLSLSIKDITNDPWEEVSVKFKINDVVEGTVVKLASFGAFVEITDGVEGLVHLSEICEENIAKPSDKLKVGDKVKVRILSLNLEEKRISLSIKEAIDKPVEDFSAFLDEEESGVSLGELFKDKLKDLM
ncbi:30S ribosomal protein S1 [Haloimpatiens lingqiaonensis]|uniref:30S ribosomal protein S1 n=1 Tax=Haloimpatiens lingqiaonensis TaxID=1380675 RepID=UPI0010FE3418|nr:30S ribosomal protein S1 [Haloimpatiens lingqiaonensis]